MYDVVIVGGGQSGLAAAYGLFREQVKNIVVLDRQPVGSEGPWKDIRPHDHVANAEDG